MPRAGLISDLHKAGSAHWGSRMAKDVELDIKTVSTQVPTRGQLVADSAVARQPKPTCRSGSGREQFRIRAEKFDSRGSTIKVSRRKADRRIRTSGKAASCACLVGWELLRWLLRLGRLARLRCNHTSPIFAKKSPLSTSADAARTGQSSLSQRSLPTVPAQIQFSPFTLPSVRF